MERALDKVVVLAACLLLTALQPFTAATLVTLLVTITCAALAELPQAHVAKVAAAGALLVVLAALPAGGLALPLVAYDLARLPWPLVRLAWLVPPLVWAAGGAGGPAIAAVAAAAGLAGLLARRTDRHQATVAAAQATRDDLAAERRALQRANAGLRQRQDTEVNLATLSERARIARDIHDNAGHLLTRSILQVEALQVVHAGDAALVTELQAVGGSLHQALDEVRAAVHALHAEAFDLKTQLFALARPGEIPAVTVEYDAADLPPAVGQTLLAIAREAHSNTIRHSDATLLRIAVVEHPGFYQLLIQDNGTVRPAPGADSGIGLTTMEERARALGGTLRTSFDHGCRVFCSIPKESPA
jgi:signal transduction histidine kinase